MIDRSHAALCALFCAALGAPAPARGAVLHMPAECPTLKACFAAMSPGDTLEIADGTYTGDENRIMGMGSDYVPPSGTCSGTAANWCAGGSYTTVKAENPGGVVIDGQGVRDTLCFSQVGPNPGMHHVILDGIQFVRAGGYCGQNDLSGASVTDRSLHHVKVLRCGFQDSVGVGYASYVLLEDVYVTGRGRYNISVGIESDHVVVRRAVMRLDDAMSGQGFPVAHAVSYGSQSVEWQNDICIDSDSSFYGEAESVYGGIYIRQTHDRTPAPYASTDNKLRGNILLNVHHRPGPNFYLGVSYAIGYGASGLEFHDGIYWDMENVFGYAGHVDQDFVLDHMTFGVSTDDGSPNAVMGSGDFGDVSNSLFFHIAGAAIADARSSDHNAFQGNGADEVAVRTSAGGVTGVDFRASHLRYLPRVEDAAGLDGSDGRKIGAEVVCRYGADGSGWGEAGYDELQPCTLGQGGHSLWPWPYEDTIKAFFLAYGTGGSSPPNARGFTQGVSMDGSPQTLTKYVWEYLGEPIPPEIYGSSAPGDPGAPAAASGCGCRTGESSGPATSAPWLLVLGGLAAARRRRSPRHAAVPHPRSRPLRRTSRRASPSPRGTGS